MRVSGGNGSLILSVQAAIWIAAHHESVTSATSLMTAGARP